MTVSKSTEALLITGSQIQENDEVLRHLFQMTWTIRYKKLRRSFSLHAHALSGSIPSIKISANFVRRLERAKGIEPSLQAWEARVLPLNYARIV